MNTKNEFNEMFKKIEVTSRKQASNFKSDEIRLMRSGRNRPLSRFVISKELTESLPWSTNERLDLFQASNNLFALVPASVGLLTLKLGGKSFQIYNTDLCTTLKALTQSTEFSGWIDDNKLFFKTAK